MKKLNKLVYRSSLILVHPTERCKTCNRPDFAYQAISTFGTVPTAPEFDKSSEVSNHVQFPLLYNDSPILVSLVLGFGLNKLGDLTSKLNCQQICLHINMKNKCS